MARDLAARRQTRKAGRKNDHGPLLDLVASETTRRPIKPRKTEVKPLNQAQAAYDMAMAANTIVFGIGPAGTGKTWLAAARAAEALRAGTIERIIVTRPAVEAGEKIGFLPGEMDEKYEPFFRPVREALVETLGSGHTDYLIKAGVIEARPLAFIRGATLKDAWVLADEMQNATQTQMKLLLTRIGDNAKFLINGDPDQCDLPNWTKSGLEDAVSRLSAIKGIATVRFTAADVVRSGMCQEIVAAYSKSAPSTRCYNDNNETGDTSGMLRTLKVIDERDGVRAGLGS